MEKGWKRYVALYSLPMVFPTCGTPYWCVCVCFLQSLFVVFIDIYNTYIYVQYIYIYVHGVWLYIVCSLQVFPLNLGTFWLLKWYCLLKSNPTRVDMIKISNQMTIVLQCQLVICSWNCPFVYYSLDVSPPRSLSEIRSWFQLSEADRKLPVAPWRLVPMLWKNWVKGYLTSERGCFCFNPFCVYFFFNKFALFECLFCLCWLLFWYFVRF